MKLHQNCYNRFYCLNKLKCFWHRLALNCEKLEAQYQPFIQIGQGVAKLLLLNRFFLLIVESFFRDFFNL